MALQAYFDESERQDGTFCVAGYAFSEPQAEKFVKQWSELFAGIKGGLHMVDLVHGVRAFNDVPPEERNSLIVEAVKIINSRISVGIAVSCNLAEVKQHSPKWIRGFGHAYPLCCHLALTALGKYLDVKQNPEKVAYVFEAGHSHEEEARTFIANAVRCEPLRQSYRYFGDSFLPKSDAVPLQAADFLAWEWAKFRHETMEQSKRRIRKSLREAFLAAPGRYKMHHVTGPSLVKFLGRIRELGLSQIEEESQSRHGSN